MLLTISYTLIYQVIAGVLIAALVAIMIRFLILSGNEKPYFPEQWIHYLKKGKVSESLKNLEKLYPDKVRFFNFWFQCERLKREKVEGAFAELGVYKGETSKILHEFDKSRKLHLFDTFEGFSKNDLKLETGEAATYKTKNFADTSVEKVLKYIGGDSKIVVQKGYFPDTTKDIPTEKYALVSIDTDLYKPVIEGLRYFYPLLTPGGVILIHDYTHKWEGLVKAVNEFVSTIPENTIEVPDAHGTVMIIKNKNI